MKVAVVCPYDLSIPGGVQQVAVELAGRLEAAGDEVVLTGPGRGDAWISTGGSVSFAANRSRAAMSLSPAAWWRARRAVAGADIVHVHEPFLPLVGPAALTARTPTVATFHADPSPLVRRLYFSGEGIGRRLLEGSTITAVSPVAASAIPSSWGRTLVVPNGIDLAAHRSQVEKDPGLVVFLGRDEPRKGFDVLVEAWPLVLSEVPGVRLEVAGFTRDQGPPATKFLGRVSEPEKRGILGRASVLVTPNLGGESFGIVLVEGMASGCAVVASDLEAFRHVAGDAARFAPVGDAEQLAEQLVALLSRPADVASLGETARERAARFDWDTVVSTYRRLYLDRLESV